MRRKQGIGGWRENETTNLVGNVKGNGGTENPTGMIGRQQTQEQAGTRGSV